MATVTPDIKVDEAPDIKTDPDVDLDGSSPMPIPDEDAYEDTGELEMPKEMNSAFLMRVPKQLYNSWASIEEDEPIEIGFIRQYKNSNKRELHLNRNLEQHQKLPKLYDVTSMGKEPHNMFVFTEKDLPGYKPKSAYENRSSQNEVKKDGTTGASQSGDRPRRNQPYFRKAIPKQTALVASIGQEGFCHPVENDEYRQLMKETAEEQQSKRQDISLLQGDVRQYASMVIGAPASRAPNEGGFDTFVRNVAQPSRQNISENKHVREAQDKLLDKIFECFQKYKYWPMSALKQELKQPEAHIKETLAMVAELVKSGPQVGTYKLKPESEMKNVVLPAKDEEARDEMAPEGIKDEMSGDDDDMQMEDAL